MRDQSVRRLSQTRQRNTFSLQGIHRSARVSVIQGDFGTEAGSSVCFGGAVRLKSTVSSRCRNDANIESCVARGIYKDRYTGAGASLRAIFPADQGQKSGYLSAHDPTPGAVNEKDSLHRPASSRCSAAVTGGPNSPALSSFGLGTDGEKPCPRRSTPAPLLSFSSPF